MKKSIFFLFAASVVIASCSKEVTENQSQKSVISFDAAASDCSKTVLTDNVKTYWCPGDAIAVFDDSSNNKFTTAITSNSAVASFSGTASSSSVYYSVYPYNEAASLSGASISTTLPDVQSAQDGGYDPNAALLVSSTTNNVMTFIPATALLKMQVKEGTVSVTVAGNANEGIAGNVAITVSENIAVAGGSKKSVVLKKSDDSVLAATNYYIAVKPDTYASGLTVTLTNAEGKTIVKTTGKSQTLNAGSISDMGLIDGDWGGESYNYMIFSDKMENGWKLGGTDGKFEITSEEAATGTKSIKWTVDSYGSWSRILTLGLPDAASMDASAYTGLSFKMKLSNMSSADKSTFARIQISALNGTYSEVNVYSSAETDWVEVVYNFAETCTATDLSQLKNLCFFTPGWYAITGTVYIDDVKLIGGAEPEPDDDLHIFQDTMASGWALGGTEGKYSISTDEAYEGTKSIKWIVDSYADWARILTLGLAEGNMDATAYSSLSFKMKLTNMSTTELATFARIQLVGVGGYSEVNVYTSSETDWVEVVYNFTEQCATTDFAKFSNLCFFTPGWYAVTGTVYIDDVKFVKAK